MTFERNKYIFPEFYTAFRCQGPSCKDNCCHDWLIAFDKETFLKWEQVKEPSFRVLRDHFVRLNQSPAAPDAWGCILHDEKGRCGFQDADGGCRMIRLLGEDALCSTCRTYPRRKNEFVPGQRELSLSLSCEEAVRLGVIQPDEITFTESYLQEDRLERSLSAAGIGKQGAVIDPPSWGDLLRKVCLGLIQTREMPLKERLTAISLLLKRIDRALSQQKEDQIPTELLAFVRAVDAGQLRGFFEKLSYYPDAHAAAFQLPAGHILAGREGSLKDALKKQLGENLNLDENGRLLIDGSSGKALLDLVQRKGDPLLERHPVWMENFLANYMFSAMFPFLYHSQGASFEEHSFLLFHLYGLIRSLLALSSEELSDEERFTAAAVHAARLTQHGDFASDFNALRNTFDIRESAVLFYILR